MKPKSQYYVIDKAVLPEVFIKVMEVKELLQGDELMTVQDATEQVGISRSSFYKYKDYIMPFYEKGRGHTITVLIHLEDEAGKLSQVLNYVADIGGNIITINQMIPMNGIALINLCIETMNMQMGIDEFLVSIKALPGIKEAKILARE